MSKSGPDDPFPTASQEQWQLLVAKLLDGEDIGQRLATRTLDDLTIQPLYTQANEITDEIANVVVVGRGGGSSNQEDQTRDNAGRGASWTSQGTGWEITQLHQDADPGAVNEAILADLAGGATAIVIQIAAPGQIGLPAEPAAMVEALRGVDLHKCSLALSPGECFGNMAAYLLGSFAMGKVRPQDRKGAFNADPLGTLAAYGGLSQPLGATMIAAAALLAKAQQLPLVTAMLADGRPYHEAGASEAQELAVMLATLVAYLRNAETAGIAPNQALPKIAIGLSADTDQFATIAKLRAARGLIWRVAHGAGCEEAAKSVHMSATTSMRMLAKCDPQLNILRGAIACAAAGMGGADAITVLPFTAAIGLPDPLARRIARNTQIILQLEAGLGRVLDPAGGSWYVENLTDELARKAWEIFQDIETQGGMAAALNSGFVQDMIGTTAAKRAALVASGQLPLTGVSIFPKPAEKPLQLKPYPRPIAIRTAGASVVALPASRLAEPFEDLCAKSADFAAANGKPPVIFLAQLGKRADAIAATTFATSLFAAGGVHVATGTVGNDPKDAQVLESDKDIMLVQDVASAFESSGAAIACICAGQEIEKQLVEAMVAILKSAGAKLLYLTFAPVSMAADLRTAGIDRFIFKGCDMLAALKAAQNVLAGEQ